MLLTSGGKVTSIQIHSLHHPTTAGLRLRHPSFPTTIRVGAIVSIWLATTTIQASPMFLVSSPTRPPPRTRRSNFKISDPGARFLDAREVGQMVKDWRAKIGRTVTKSVGGRVDISEEKLGLNPNDPQLARKGPSTPSGPSSLVAT